MNNPYLYVVLHQSCRNRVGVAAVQAAHAASERLRVPASDQTFVVALVAESSADLEALAARLADAKIHHAVIREPDPPYNGAATAVGIEPRAREVVRPFVAGFKVFR